MKGSNDSVFETILLNLLVLFIALGPAILLSLIGSNIKYSKPKIAKVLQIIAVVYAIIGIGTCGMILTNF